MELLAIFPYDHDQAEGITGGENFGDLEHIISQKISTAGNDPNPKNGAALEVFLNAATELNARDALNGKLQRKKSTRGRLDQRRHRRIYKVCFKRNSADTLIYCTKH